MREGGRNRGILRYIIKSMSIGNLSLLQTPSRTADIEHDVEEEGRY